MVVAEHAVVLPDNVLFEGGAGERIRRFFADAGIEPGQSVRIQPGADGVLHIGRTAPA